MKPDARTLSSVLIISPYFPPSTLAGVHRARHLAKHLPTHGWRPIILCVDERDQEERLDPDLAQLLPREVEVVRVRAAPARLTRIASIGDVSLRGWFNLRRTLLRILATQTIDVVMISGSPFYPMLFTPTISRRFRVPVVLDFQDPWVSSWGAAQSHYSKAGLSHRIAAVLEPRAVGAARFITSVSEGQNAEMLSRYPHLDQTCFEAIPIGGEPGDFEATRMRLSSELPIQLDTAHINLSYVGTFLPRAATVMRTLFRAVAHLRKVDPGLAARLRLNFVGTSNQPNGFSAYGVQPLANEQGVADLVREIPQRIPYLQALAVLAKSQGLLLLGSDEPHYTASKIYPALMSGQPFVSLYHRASSAHAILSAAGGGKALAFATTEELETLVIFLADALRTLALRPGSLGKADPAAYDPYTAASVTRRFASIFDRLRWNELTEGNQSPSGGI